MDYIHFMRLMISNLQKKRKIQNGSEWYYGRLIESGTYRPISGHKTTKEHHLTNFGNGNYFDNIDKIIDDKEKIKNWVKTCKNNGASYIILTSKHHDGVCLWNTNTTNKKSKLDILDIFKNECIENNIDFGFYYSWLEFGQPFSVNYFTHVCLPQIEELLKYNPKYMWFDGHWKITQKSIIKSISKIIETMKSGGILINDRIGGNNYEQCDYRVFSDRYIPTEKLNIKWQHVNTIGYSWGYNKTQVTDYKTGEDIYKLYLQITDLGGELLLNIGPNQNGDIIDEELSVLKYLREKL